MAQKLNLPPLLVGKDGLIPGGMIDAFTRTLRDWGRGVDRHIGLPVARIALEPGWIQFPGYAPPKCTMIGGVLTISAVVQNVSGVTRVAPFTWGVLPVGYRVEEHVAGQALHGLAVAQFDVLPNGELQGLNVNVADTSFVLVSASFVAGSLPPSPAI